MTNRTDHHTLRQNWRIALARYLAAITVLNLLWEIAHMPLYTLWDTGSRSEILYSVIHCTIGDLLIALCCIALALMLVGQPGWPTLRACRVLVVTLVLGFAYTGFSEWLNIEIRESWAYSDLMPIIPFLNMGLSPALQWVVVPWVGYVWAIKNKSMSLWKLI